MRITVNPSCSAHPTPQPASIAHLCSLLDCSTFGKGSKAVKTNESTQYHRPTYTGGREQSAWLPFLKTSPCEQRGQAVSLHQSGWLWLNVLPRANACHSRVWRAVLCSCLVHYPAIRWLEATPSVQLWGEKLCF